MEVSTGRSIGFSEDEDDDCGGLVELYVRLGWWTLSYRFDPMRCVDFRSS